MCLYFFLINFLWLFWWIWLFCFVSVSYWKLIISKLFWLLNILVIIFTGKSEMLDELQGFHLLIFNFHSSEFAALGNFIHLKYNFISMILFQPKYFVDMTIKNWISWWCNVNSSWSALLLSLLVFLFCSNDDILLILYILF